MAYDRIFSASRSRAWTVQRSNDRKTKLRTLRARIERTTRLRVREYIDCRAAASEYVRAEICSECNVGFPEQCEGMRNQNNMYFCRLLSNEYALVRLYLSSRTRPNPNSPHSRSNLANRLEELIRTEPGITQGRIGEEIRGRRETTLDVLENDLVFQGRVRKVTKMNGKKKSFQYYIIEDEPPASVPEFNDTICESEV